jgi:hypothetical protein
MIRTVAILIVTTLVVLPAAAQRRGFRGGSDSAPPPLANTDAERRIFTVLEQMRQNGTTHLSVPPSDGRLLRLLTESVNAQRVVEIGTSLASPVFGCAWHWKAPGQADDIRVG